MIKDLLEVEIQLEKIQLAVEGPGGPSGID